MSAIFSVTMSNVSTDAAAVTLSTVTLPTYDVALTGSMTALALNTMFYLDAGNENGWRVFTQSLFRDWVLSSYSVTPTNSPSTTYAGASFGQTGTFPSISNFTVEYDPSYCFLSSPGQGAGTLGYEFTSYLYSFTQGLLSVNPIQTNKYASIPNYLTYISTLQTNIDTLLQTKLITSAASGTASQNLGVSPPLSFNTNPPVSYQIASQLYTNYSSRFYDASNNWMSLPSNRWGLLRAGDTVIFSIINVTTSSTQKSVYNQTLAPKTRKYILRIYCT